MVQVAYINAFGKRVGAVFWEPSKQLGYFEYAPNFLQSGIELAPLTMPLSAQRVFSFPELIGAATFKGLPGLLADVMPDRYGHALINAWLARNGRASNSLNPVELLCFIGKRGMGALEFEPAESVNFQGSTALEVSELIAFAQAILSNKMKITSRLAKNKEHALQSILKVGTSAGGARAKAVIAYNPTTHAIKSGQLDVPTGFSHWLIKFDGVTDSQSGVTMGYGRVEMAYHLMAVEAGIHMMPCRLLEENGRAHFMTQRFDRTTDGKKLHVQTLCAMRHFDFNDVLSFSYEQVFETMRLLHLPYSAADQMYRRMVFNVLLRNCDDHTKNFAFLLNANYQWELAPAYDLCHAYRPGSEWVSQHALSMNGKRSQITKNDLLVLAKKMNIKQPLHIIDQVNHVARQWPKFAKRTEVDASLSKAIQKTLPLLT